MTRVRVDGAFDGLGRLRPIMVRTRPHAPRSAGEGEEYGGQECGTEAPAQGSKWHDHGNKIAEK
jgi:hypothetical protein